MQNVNLKGATISADQLQSMLANGFTGTFPDGTIDVPEPSLLSGIVLGIFGFIGLRPRKKP